MENNFCQSVQNPVEKEKKKGSCKALCAKALTQKIMQVFENKLFRVFFNFNYFLFSFKYFDAEDVRKEINNINSKKLHEKAIYQVKVTNQAPVKTCFNQNIKNSALCNELEKCRYISCM